MRKFPELKKLAYESRKSQRWNTIMQRSASGKMRTLTTQLLPNWLIEASFPALTDAEAKELQGFCALVKGAQEPFLWLDPEDNTEKNMRLAEITTGKYQAVMKMGDYVEAVGYIENVSVYRNGELVESSLYSVVDGIVSFRTVPAAEDIITADYTYYWKVHFTEDELNVDRIFIDVNKVSFSLEIVR